MALKQSSGSKGPRPLTDRWIEGNRRGESFGGFRLPGLTALQNNLLLFHQGVIVGFIGPIGERPSSPLCASRADPKADIALL